MKEGRCYPPVIVIIIFLELIQFPGSEALQVAPDSWRPVTIEVGAFGSLTGISKLVASVIGPLADEGVSVFCLSTNQEDYVMVRLCFHFHSPLSLSSSLSLSLSHSGKRDRFIQGYDMSSSVFQAISGIRTRRPAN